MSVSSQQLFQEEFGQYIQAASEQNRIGVCSKCLSVRSRSEVDPQERCPADLMQTGLEELNRAGQHEWIGFTEPGKLEEFLKENFPRFKQLAQQAAQGLQIESEE